MILFARMYKKPYWIAVLCAGILGVLLYNLFLFRSMPGKTRTVSELILILCVVGIGGFFGILSDSDRERTLYNVLINTLFSLEMYWLFSRGFYCVPSSMIKAFLLVQALIIVCYGYKVLSPRIRDPKVRERIKSERWNKIFDFGYQIAIIFYLVMLVYAAIEEPAFVKKKAATSSVPDVQEAVEAHMDDNMDTLVLLSDDLWSELPQSEQIRVLQTVADIETTYMGLPFALKVVLDDGSEVPAKAMACYRDSEHTIYLAENHLLAYDSKECVNSVCHEAYHAYQHVMLSAYDSLDPEYQNLLIFDSLRYYKAEFAPGQYVGSDENDDYDEYMKQLCEVNAREWADSATEDYFEKIDNYMETHSPE